MTFLDFLSIHLGYITTGFAPCLIAWFLADRV